MSYEYTDGRGASIIVHPLLPGPAVEIATRKGIVTLGREEAYNLALGALTTPGEPESDKVLQAIILLKEHQQERAEAQAREAEDAKVRAFRESDQRARGVNPDAFPWEALAPHERASWTSRCRAAREFFTRTDDGTDYHAEAES